MTTRSKFVLCLASFVIVMGAIIFLMPQQKASAAIDGLGNCPGPQSPPYMHATNHASNGGSSHSHYPGLERYDMPDSQKDCAEFGLRSSTTVVQVHWGGEYTETPTHHVLNLYGSILVDKDLATPGRITESSFTYIDSYMIDYPASKTPISGSNGLVSISSPTINLGTIDKDQSKVVRQSIQVDKSRMKQGHNWVCVEAEMEFKFNSKSESSGGGGWCVELLKTPIKPIVNQYCSGTQVRADIDWLGGGSKVVRYSVQISDNNFAVGGGYWYRAPIALGTTSIPDAPINFVPGGGAVGPLTLDAGKTYYIRVLYDREPGDWSNYYYGETEITIARSDCDPKPVPPAPTVTPTCTANKPTFDITWNAVAGLSPTSFTVDLDDNNFAGGTGWLYKDVPSTGPGPYSANSAPNSFLSFGTGPTVPLNPGSPYQFRVNYRGAGTGGADIPTPTVTRNARTDCVPPPSITCVSVNPSIVEASPTPYDVQVGYQNASGSAALTGATVTARVATAPMQSTGTAVSPDLPGDGSVRLAPLLNIVTPIPGEYDISLVFTGGNTPGSPLTVSCAQKLAAYNGPYFRVFGGDVMTGGYSSATCSAWPVTLGSNGSIFAFNKSDGTPAMSGKGAGTQLLVQAMATVNGFSSAQHRTSPPYPPAPQPAHDKGLTFANASASQFGGAFNIGSCPPDYFANKSATAGASNPLALPPASQVSGPYIVSAGSVTSSPVHTIGNGKSIVIYVNGNAFVTGNIVYQPGPWSTVNDIPSFTLVAKGNIYISQNVTRLDGIYIAQPASSAPGDGGALYTCSITPPAIPTAAQVASQCTSPLTINGAVMARSIKLLRSSGTAREANPADCPLSLPASNIYNCTGSSTAAEQFIYTPEIWIRSNSLRRPSRPSSYDVVSNLPPIL